MPRKTTVKGYRLLKMDNTCFQDDSTFEMENVRLEERNGKIAEKERSTVSFESTSNTKIDVTETGVSQMNKPHDEPCQPQLCKEVNKCYQKMMETNSSFDPMLKVKTIFFIIICLTLLVWALIHFLAINSPNN